VDKAALVANDLEIEGLVVEALSRAKIPVTAVDWIWVPQFEASQLVIVTSLHGTKGPRIPIREIFVISPEDPLAQELVQQLKLTTEGTIHVSRTIEDGRAHYSLVFTPYLGKGGAVPSVRLNGDEELRSFLEKRLGILPYLVDQALGQLAQKGAASILNVQLNLRRAKKLNLAA
jgi:hypothetical protein